MGLLSIFKRQPATGKTTAQRLRDYVTEAQINAGKEAFMSDAKQRASKATNGKPQRPEGAKIILEAQKVLTEVKPSELKSLGEAALAAERNRREADGGLTAPQRARRSKRAQAEILEAKGREVGLIMGGYKAAAEEMLPTIDRVKQELRERAAYEKGREAGRSEGGEVTEVHHHYGDEGQELFGSTARSGRKVGRV